jgi:hypothetical protein
MKKGDMVRLKRTVQRTGKRAKARIIINYRSGQMAGSVVLDNPLDGGFRMWNRKDLEVCR